MENSLNKIISKEQLRENIFSLYKKGLPTGEGIGLESVDGLIRWELCRLSVITGVPNHGKSEFLDFINIRLNKKLGWKIVYFSPENFPIAYHIQKLVSKITNKKFDKNKLMVDELEDTIDYISNNFFFMNFETIHTIDDILKTTLELISKEGVKILVIDPFNRLEHQRPRNLSETEYISQVLDKLNNFAKRHKILIHLVAHPRKMTVANGALNIPNYYDINGSANFANKADYCLTVHRNFPENTTGIHVQKVKFKNLGQVGDCELKYNMESGNYYELEKTKPDDNLDFLYQNSTGTDNDFVNIVKEKLAQKREQHRNQVNVLNVDVSFFDNIMDNTPKTINLYNFLSNKMENIDLDILRKKTNFKELKKELPCVTVSGLFKNKRNVDNLEKHSGLLCIDIDQKDNDLPMVSIFTTLKKLNNVAYLGRSCSGNGLFAIIPITDANKHKAHFDAIKEDLSKQNIYVDSSCVDVSRLRIYSYDENAYYNVHAEPYTNLKYRERSLNRDNDIDIEDSEIKLMLDDIRQNKIDITSSYKAWFEIGCALWSEFGEEGRSIYHQISQNHPQYHPDDTDAQFDKCSDYDYEFSIATLFHYYYSLKEQKKQWVI